MTFLKRFCCWMGMHEWTCAASEGEKPLSSQLKSVDGFWKYARMYCKNCGKPSGLNHA